MKKLALFLTFVLSISASAQLKEPGLLMYNHDTNQKMSQSEIQKAMADDELTFNLVQAMRETARNPIVKSLSAEIGQLLNKPIYLMTGHRGWFFWPAYNATDKVNPSWDEMQIGFNQKIYSHLPVVQVTTPQEMIEKLEIIKKALIEKNAKDKELEKSAKDFSKVNSNINPSNDI